MGLERLYKQEWDDAEQAMTASAILKSELEREMNRFPDLSYRELKREIVRFLSKEAV